MLLIDVAFQKALGRSVDPNLESKLAEFYSSHQGIMNYWTFVNMASHNWIQHSADKHEIPKGTKY